MTRVAIRSSAGFTLEQAAKRVRVGVEYLKRLERGGRVPYSLACRLAALYGVGLDNFVIGPGKGC